jgi:hypothetical protein
MNTLPSPVGSSSDAEVVFVMHVRRYGIYRFNTMHNPIGASNSDTITIKKRLVGNTQSCG